MMGEGSGRRRGETVVMEGVVGEIIVGTTYQIPLRFFKGERGGERFEVPLDHLIRELEVGDWIRVCRKGEG